MILKEIEDDYLSLYDAKEEILEQSESIVTYTIGDLDNLRELFDNKVLINPQETINRCTTCLTMVLNNLDNIKAISEKCHHLSNKEL